MPDLLYFIGQPGSGKTTLVRTLTENHSPYTVKKPFAHTLWQPDKGGKEVMELGELRGTFSGTDTLAMDVQRRVVAQLQGDAHPRVLGEGDRLSNESFFDAVRSLGYGVTVVYLDVPDDIAAAWRLERAERGGGKPQNEAWVKGRITKAARLAEKVDAVRITDTDIVGRVDALVALDNPVIGALVA